MQGHVAGSRGHGHGMSHTYAHFHIASPLEPLSVHAVACRQLTGPERCGSYEAVRSQLHPAGLSASPSARVGVSTWLGLVMSCNRHSTRNTGAGSRSSGSGFRDIGSPGSSGKPPTCVVPVRTFGCSKRRSRGRVSRDSCSGRPLGVLGRGKAPSGSCRFPRGNAGCSRWLYLHCGSSIPVAREVRACVSVPNLGLLAVLPDKSTYRLPCEAGLGSTARVSG